MIYKNKQVALVAIYGHPEAYPPTLNCIQEVSKIFSKVYLLGRNVYQSAWSYPENCTEKLSGGYADLRAIEQMHILRRVLFFITFTKDLFFTVSRQKPDLVLVYDPMSLFAYLLIIKIVKKKVILWYHNHDVFSELHTRKYSLQWWAGKSEAKYFNKIDIFSLPADERMGNFPLNNFKGKYFTLPNYPAVDFQGKFYQPKKIENEIKLLFQGAISEGHGLEELTQLLDFNANGKKISLTIKGWMRDDIFKIKLQRIADSLGCPDSLKFLGFGPYNELPLVTSGCHIGIGIHSLNVFLHKTLGKASNKLYEYSSVGLPIIVFDDPHYRFHLEKYQWVFFTDLSAASLKKCIIDIISNYENLSRCAHEDFLKELNFELSFKPVATYLKSLSYQEQT
jgi:glycosyltransferase involved in cell wall biosynthesis